MTGTDEVEFDYTRQGLCGRDRRLQRLFEIVPGAASWSVLAGLSALSFIRPVWALVLILAFDLFWLLSLVYSLVLLMLSSCRLAIERHTTWMAWVRALDSAPDSEAAPRTLSDRIHRRELAALRRSGEARPSSEAIHHVVILSLENESRAVIERAVESLLRQTFPLERTIVVLALEESAPRKVREAAWELHREHYERFLALHVAPCHAKAGENGGFRADDLNYAAKLAAEIVHGKGIAAADVVVSRLDAHSVPSPEYLACLTWNFLRSPHRCRASFQPIPVYDRNIWEVPAIARVLETGSSFVHIVEATNPDRLVTFTSHSMSIASLEEVGYWPAGMISDDSSIFWKCYLRFGGDFRVVPMYCPLSLDVPYTGPFLHAAGSVYREKCRKAWAIENFPIVLRGFLATNRIPLAVRLRRGFTLLHNHVVSATWPFIVLVIGWLPGISAAVHSPASLVSYNAPRIQAVVLFFVLGALAVCLALSLLHLPRKGSTHPVTRVAFHLLEWLLLALPAIFLDALSALEVQSRMIFGKYPRDRRSERPSRGSPERGV